MSRSLTLLVSVFIVVFVVGADAEPTRFSWHDKGLVPFQASQMDPRFSYMMYVPNDYDESGLKPYPLIVLMHGTERAPHRYLEQNRAFAQKHGFILLAPLFPVGSHGGNGLENYKLLSYEGTRYDLILLSMVDEVRSKYRINGERFSLFGFSGGGHFAHRFYYLHPHRLTALSIGAPGMVTLIDDDRDWWVGTRDLYRQFNARMNLDAMRKVNVQMVIGEEDTEGWGDEIERWSPYYMGKGTPGATYNSAGKNRIERLTNLKKNYEKHGIKAQLNLVEDAGHDESLMFPTVQRFFLEQQE